MSTSLSKEERSHFTYCQTKPCPQEVPFYNEVAKVLERGQLGEIEGHLGTHTPPLTRAFLPEVSKVSPYLNDNVSGSDFTFCQGPG